MKHIANPRFWGLYHALPADIQKLADKSFALLCKSPDHPSLHFKKIGTLWTARVGLHCRAVALEEESRLIWFWIGTHDEYENIIRRA